MHRPRSQALTVWADVCTSKLQPSPVPPCDAMSDTAASLQLASFMSELESSGLLEREAAPSPDADTKADPQLATTSEPNLAAAIVDAVNDDTAAVPQQQDLSDLPEQAAAGLANADAAPSEPAEQRVLGDLDGAPTWREVPDSCPYMFAVT